MYGQFELLGRARRSLHFGAAVRAAALAAPLLACGSTGEPPAARSSRLLPTEWRFTLQDVASAQDPALDDGSWQEVRVPHTWNALDGQDGGGDYVRGVGWYRRHFSAPAKLEGRRFYLQFDAANQVAQVWVNGQALGEHRGGYSTFRFDATEALRTGDNVLAVRVNNAHDDNIPPLRADYTFFGGLYRPVHFLDVSEVHVDLDDFGASGVYLDAQLGENGTATVAARVGITNASALPASVDAEVVLTEASGQEVARERSTVEIASGDTAVARLELPVATPRLWNGLSDPHVYTARVELREGGELLDTVQQPFGIRSFRVSAEQGFFLNGEYLDLHGVNRHQDRLDLGWAIGAEHHDEDMALIREIGATSVRLAHYQQAQEFYDRCDREGLVVWAEIPLVDEITDSQAFDDNTRQQMIELIRQSYNHPSIALWGIGNEQRADDEATNRLLASLAELTRQEDPTRLSAYAHCCNPENSALTQHTDTIGYNSYWGWYMGRVSSVGRWADAVHDQSPSRPIALSEYGAGASLVQHEDNPSQPITTGPFHPEEYQTNLHEGTWLQLAERPFIWGKYVWNMFDFASDGRSEGDAEGRNDKGLVTYDRQIRKDAFFWYKANWSDQPVLHITSRRFEPRLTPTIDVKVYSNLTQVQLSVNGQPVVGESPARHVYLFADVPLRMGQNEVRASALSGESPVTDTVTWTRQ